MKNPNKEQNSVYKLKIGNAEKVAWSMNDILVPAYMVTMSSEIDASSLLRLRRLAQDKGFPPPTYTAIVMKTVALLMKNNPAANRAIFGLPFFKRLFQFNNVDISIAVEKNLPFLPGLAYAEPIKSTDKKTLIQISKELKDLALCDETTNVQYSLYMQILKYLPRPLSTFMINAPYFFPSLWVKFRGCAAWVNAPSKAGADFVATTWPWPMTFSFGIVKPRPFVIEDKVEVRTTIPLVLVFDRRIMGGGPASRLFAEFQELLSQSDVLFAEEFNS